jgi:hypothetical protein
MLIIVWLPGLILWSLEPAAAVLRHRGKLPPTQLVSDDVCSPCRCTSSLSRAFSAVKCTHHWPQPSASLSCVVFAAGAGSSLGTTVATIMQATMWTNLYIPMVAAACRGKLPPTQLVPDDYCGLSLPLYVVIEPHLVSCQMHTPLATTACCSVW